MVDPTIQRHQTHSLESRETPVKYLALIICCHHFGMMHKCTRTNRQQIKSHSLGTSLEKVADDDPQIPDHRPNKKRDPNPDPDSDPLPTNFF